MLISGLESDFSCRLSSLAQYLKGGEDNVHDLVSFPLGLQTCTASDHHCFVFPPTMDFVQMVDSKILFPRLYDVLDLS